MGATSCQKVTSPGTSGLLPPPPPPHAAIPKINDDTGKITRNRFMGAASFAPRCDSAARPFVASARTLSREQRQVDRVGHLLVAGGIQVKAVTAVVGRLQLGRIRRVAHGGVEVDDAVELPALDVG